MRVLIACEYSGVVRDAFKTLGHEALSCDLLPTDKPGQHHQGDIIEFIQHNPKWDLMICHPPCKYLAASGLHWNKRIIGRDQLTLESLNFVKQLLDLGVKQYVFLDDNENPVMVTDLLDFHSRLMSIYTEALNEYYVEHEKIKKMRDTKKLVGLNV